MTWWTALIAHPTNLLGEADLGEEGRQLVSMQVEGQAAACGLKKILFAQGHEEGRKEAEEAGSEAPSPGAIRRRHVGHDH